MERFVGKPSLANIKQETVNKHQKHVIFSIHAYMPVSQKEID